jgi:beta-lactamase superfamily II metal-dependent hydrolase
MPTRHVIAVDLADVWRTPDRRGLLRTLGWGDQVEVLARTSKHVEVRAFDFAELPDGSIEPRPISGFIVPRASSGLSPADVTVPPAENRVLKVDFVDVQQGDGAVIETPKGTVVLLDGGDNQLFARYLASRFRGTSPARPRRIDCIVVTHGDADHFAGLTKIHESETHPTASKRLFIRPDRVYHNGLVKRPSRKGARARPERDMLGPTVTRDGRVFVTGLVEDLLAVPLEEMNEPFRQWRAALEAWRARGPIAFRRLAQGDGQAFRFLEDEGLRVEILGPITTSIDGTAALPFLGRPPAGPRIGHDSTSVEEGGFKGLSASHTINGHSIVFRLACGQWSFLFAGDLNDEAGRALTRAHNRGELNLQAEIFKVPHHGSADFSGAFFKAVAPVVSVVSSGDESARKEFIHPRATLMGALGRHSRLEEPLVFVTELVAFFDLEGWVTPEQHRLKEGEVVLDEHGRALKDPRARPPFFAFRRTAFGLVATRTDGRRLLVVTNSGNVSLKEAYAYEMDPTGLPRPAAVVRV